MTNLIPLLVFTIVIHVAMVGTGVFLSNLDLAANYGGETGLLPTSDSSGGAYDQFSSWLMGSGPKIDEVGQGGGVSIFQWIVRTPLCGMVSVVKYLIILTTLNHEVLTFMPTDGFGNWFRILVHAAGIVLTLMLFGRVIEFAVRAGVFSNIYMLGIVLGVSAIGLVATLINATGGFTCRG